MILRLAGRWLGGGGGLLMPLIRQQADKRSAVGIGIGFDLRVVGSLGWFNNRFWRRRGDSLRQMKPRLINQRCDKLELQREIYQAWIKSRQTALFASRQMVRFRRGAELPATGNDQDMKSVNSKRLR